MPTLQRAITFGKLNLPISQRPDISLSALESKDSKVQESATSEMMKQLQADGFFYLDVKDSSQEKLPEQAAALAESFQKNIKAVSQTPELSSLNAKGGGYSHYFEIETTQNGLKDIGQQIDALVTKPMLFEKIKDSEKLSESVQTLVEKNKHLYHDGLFGLAKSLLKAFEQAFKLPQGKLTQLIQAQDGGALRTAYYDKPAFINISKPTNGTTVQGIIPHTDESLLSLNLHETQPGLTHLDENNDKTTIPNKTGAIIVTAGRIFESLSKDSSNSIKGFKHTMINSGDRLVQLGFIAPDLDKSLETLGSGQPIGTTREHHQKHEPETNQ